MPLWEYQEPPVIEAAQKLASGVRKLCFQLATGGGKCLAKDTNVLMFDGSIKKVQNILPGDLLIGPDSKPKKVLSTCKGREMMYRITPVKGDSYVVNESHILSLRRTNQRNNSPYPSGNRGGEIVNIPVKEYINRNETFKHIHKGWRSGCVEFKGINRDIFIDPYILGLWLGDGNSKGVSFAVEDAEIQKTLIDCAKKNNLRLRIEDNTEKCTMYHMCESTHSGRGGGGNSILNHLRYYNLLYNKHIPNDYKTASKKIRLAVLAGLLDSDGHLHNNGFDYISKIEQLSDDVCFIARSIGLAAYKKKCRKTCENNGVVGTYYRVSISGDCSIIPTKVFRKKANKRKQIKNVLNVGIKVSVIGVGDYYGFELDGDGLFLLGDFTVTHNTVIFSYICKSWLAKNPGKSILILVHREELLNSARTTLYNECGITAFSITAGKNHIPPAPVYVGMVESTKTRLGRLPNIGLLIIDEAHRQDFNKMHAYFPECNIIGFTATPLSASKKNPLKDHYEDIICGPQISVLIQWSKDHPGQGLCQNVTYAPKDIVDRAELAAVKNGIIGNDFNIAVMAQSFSKPRYVDNTVLAYEKYAPNTKAIVFNCDIAHSKLVQQAFAKAGYDCKHLDGAMDKTTRRHILNWFKHSKNGILCNCDVATTGFDEKTIETVIVNRSTMSLPLWLQMDGRGSRSLEWKMLFTIIDMGGNAMVHGDWCDDRDWKDIFFNPPKPGKPRDIPAPVKNCPQCDAIIPAPCKTCRYCGYEYPDKEEKPEGLLPDFVRVTKNIDISVLMQHKEKKKMWSFMQVGRELAKAAKDTIDQMTDEKAEFIYSKYIEQLEVWAVTHKHKLYLDHKNQAKIFLYAELQRYFKSWVPNMETSPENAEAEKPSIDIQAEKSKQLVAKTASYDRPTPEAEVFFNARQENGDGLSRTEFTINAPDFETFNNHFKLF